MGHAPYSRTPIREGRFEVSGIELRLYGGGRTSTHKPDGSECLLCRFGDPY